MLYSIDTGKRVDNLPHKKEFAIWRSRISDEDYNKVIDELTRKIGESDIHTAGWMPGHDWTNTVYEPLYHACLDNVEQSGLFFGLIVFKILMEQDKVWWFGRFEKDGKEIRSMTYFTKPTSSRRT